MEQETRDLMSVVVHRYARSGSTYVKATNRCFSTRSSKTTSSMIHVQFKIWEQVPLYPKTFLL